MKNKKTDPGAKYLTIDLEIRARRDLTPLAIALSERLFLQHVGRIPRTFLVSFAGSGNTADISIKRFAAEIVKLPPSLRRLWDNADDRVFDMALETTGGKHPFALGLRPETIITMAKLNARIALTVYPAIPLPRRAKLSRSTASKRRVKRRR